MNNISHMVKKKHMRDNENKGFIKNAEKPPLQACLGDSSRIENSEYISTHKPCGYGCEEGYTFRLLYSF